MPVGSPDLNRPVGCDSGRFRFLVGSSGRGLCYLLSRGSDSTEVGGGKKNGTSITHGCMRTCEPRPQPEEERALN